MHTETTKEYDKHWCPHVILYQCVPERVHFTTISEDCVEERTTDGENEGDCDQGTERIDVVLINRLSEPTFKEIIDQSINPSTSHSI